MPCDTIQVSTVEFLETHTDLKLLAQALTKMGFTVTETEDGLRFLRYDMSGTYAKKTGKFLTSGYSKIDITEVKKEYSEQCVNQMAKKNGWQLEWTTAPDGHRVAKAKKRI